MPIKATATIQMTLKEARALWDFNTDEQRPYPKGQDLADFVAEYVCNTLKSNWQYDAKVFADVRAGAVITARLEE